MGFWKAGEVTQTLPVPPLLWLMNQLSLRLRRVPCRVHNPRPRTHPLGICQFSGFCFFYLLFISHRFASHRSKGVTAKGEQLPGNCVLLGKGSLMAPAGAALWALACICRVMQSCTCGFYVPLPYLPAGKPWLRVLPMKVHVVLVTMHALLTPAPCLSAVRLHELPGECKLMQTRGAAPGLFHVHHYFTILQFKLGFLSLCLSVALSPSLPPSLFFFFQ